MLAAGRCRAYIINYAEFAQVGSRPHQHLAYVCRSVAVPHSEYIKRSSLDNRFYAINEVVFGNFSRPCFL